MSKPDKGTCMACGGGGCLAVWDSTKGRNVIVECNVCDGNGVA